MIDLENKIFNEVATVLRAAYSGISVSDDYQPMSAKFPCVTIEQMESSVVASFRSSSRIENLTRVMFEVNVYSNSTKGKKKEAKAIMETADAKFGSMGFTRTMLSPTPNLADATIYRLTARYEAAIGKDSTKTDNDYIIYNI